MSRLRSWITEPRALLDIAVVAVVAILSIVDTASASAEAKAGTRPADAVTYALVVAGSICLIRRRQTPVAALAIVTAVLSAYWIMDHGASLSVLGLCALYAVAAHAEHRRRAWWALGTSCATLLVVASCTMLRPPQGYAWLTALSMAAFLAGTVVAGVVIRNRERIFVDTERRAAAAEGDRLVEAERAVALERRRIAREMHDVVAHSMSVIAVQAAAGREIVRHDADKAARVFASIETVGRETLTELRRMLGVLREADDADASLVPQPQITDIAVAVEQSIATGVHTHLVIEGAARAIAPGIELAAYRIVQESLTNVRKHAGPSASATVRVFYEAQALAVEVIDDGRGAASALEASGTGHGLIGMRERVEIYGGEITSGPRDGGGYLVRAVFPITDGGETTARESSTGSVGIAVSS